MRNLRYVSAQPATDYFTWQVEVMINNFIKHGVNPNNMDVVGAVRPGEEVSPAWRKLQNHYNYVRFFFYEDDRENKDYAPVTRPNVLKKHWAAHPELSQEAIFHHDCDVVFTKRVDWSKFLEDDTWYASDCRFYIGAEYIEAKGHGIYEKMCDIVGIDKSIPRANELNSGGAQFIMKNVDAAYWQKVEDDSMRLWDFFLEDLKLHPEVKPEDATPERPAYHPIQKWTAEMWAMLWSAWYYKHEVKVVPEMEFVWATQGKDLWDVRTIFHNAGVLVSDAEKLFYKGNYQTQLPYGISNTFDPNSATYQYVQEILETAKRSCLWRPPTPAPTPDNGRMRTLEDENAELKRLVIELSLEKMRLEARLRTAAAT